MNIIQQQAKDFIRFRFDEHGKYEEFMENYKTYVRVIIPQDVAAEWLKQSKALLAIIEENERCFRRELNH